MSEVATIRISVAGTLPDGRAELHVVAGDQVILRDALVMASADEREGFVARVLGVAPELDGKTVRRRVDQLAIEKIDAKSWSRKPTTTLEPLRLVPVADLMNRPPVEWLVKGLLPRSAVVFLFGQPGSGKTFVALDWAQHVARGLPWCGRRVRQGPALLLAGEGGAGLGQRAVAWLIGHREESRAAPVDEHVPMFVCEELPHIGQAEGQQRIRAAIEAMQPRPVLFIIDTLAQALPGFDENKVADVSMALRFLADLARDYELCVIVVHHERKSSDAEGLNAMRGSSALGGAADAVIRVRRTKTEIKVEVVKQKDGRSDFEVPMRMEFANAGTDEDGAVIEVPYLRPETAEETAGGADASLDAFLSRFAATYAQSSPSATDLDDAVRSWGITRADSRHLRMVAVERGLLIRLEQGNAARYRLAASLAVPPAQAGETAEVA